MDGRYIRGMKRIIVFDLGRGGEVLAKEIAETLPCEVVSLTADRYQGLPLSPGEMRRIAERELLGYLGTDDVIMLAEIDVALAVKSYLKRRYPKQVILGGIKKLRFGKGKFVVFASERLKRCLNYQLMKARSENMSEARCDYIERKIGRYDINVMDVNASMWGMEGKTVVFLSTIFTAERKRLRGLMPKDVKMIDLNKILIREMCLELGLRGADGKKPVGALW